VDFYQPGTVQSGAGVSASGSISHAKAKKERSKKSIEPSTLPDQHHADLAMLVDDSGFDAMALPAAQPGDLTTRSAPMSSALPPPPLGVAAITRKTLDAVLVWFGRTFNPQLPPLIDPPVDTAVGLETQSGSPPPPPPPLPPPSPLIDGPSGPTGPSLRTRHRIDAEKDMKVEVEKDQGAASASTVTGELTPVAARRRTGRGAVLGKRPASHARGRATAAAVDDSASSDSASEFEVAVVVSDEEGSPVIPLEDPTPVKKKPSRKQAASSGDPSPESIKSETSPREKLKRTPSAKKRLSMAASEPDHTGLPMLVDLVLQCGSKDLERPVVPADAWVELLVATLRALRVPVRLTAAALVSPARGAAKGERTDPPL
jgi:hypothetical protein